MGAKDRLAEILRERGMTQAELARRMAPGRSQLGEQPAAGPRLYRGGRSPPPGQGARRSRGRAAGGPPAPSTEPGDEALSYADIFVQSVARAWQGGEMTGAEQLFLISLADLIRDQREQARRDAVRQLREEVVRRLGEVD